MKKLFGFLIILALLGGAFYLVQAQNSQREVPLLTSAQYKRSNPNDIYIMLVFWEECSSCGLAEELVFSPLLDVYKNNKKIHVVKVDIDEQDASVGETIAKHFKVTRIPAMLVVQRDQVLWQKVGFTEDKTDAVIDGITSTVNNALNNPR